MGSTLGIETTNLRCGRTSMLPSQNHTGTGPLAFTTCGSLANTEVTDWLDAKRTSPLDDWFVYLGFYVAFNTVQVISRQVVWRAEETSTYSSLGFCTVNCRPTASNYQLSHLRPWRGSNPGRRGGRRECYHSATVAPTLDDWGPLERYIRASNRNSVNGVIRSVSLFLRFGWGGGGGGIET